MGTNLYGSSFQVNECLSLRGRGKHLFDLPSPRIFNPAVNVKDYSFTNMDIGIQESFLKNTHTEKYKTWAKSVDEMYRLYENDFASRITERTCYQFTITCKRLVFEFYPLSGKICIHGNNKWVTVPKGSLKNTIKLLLK